MDGHGRMGKNGWAMMDEQGWMGKDDGWARMMDRWARMEGL